ncbi:thioredoxin reductase 3 [Pavlovales sp. CCMP2436]|nr:thioredoxin reductase 3 [Pavlovales sp. CCMP2436]
MEEFDLVVIGGGSGGLACAQEAAKLGKTVALCDFVPPSAAGTSWGLGGTCVNVGCIPKKLMHQAALIGGALADASSFGWEVPQPPPRHSWAKLVASVQMHVKSLSWGYRSALMSADVEYVNALARFEDAHTVVATDKEGVVRRLRATSFVIAVGGRPRYLDEVPGGRELVITSDDLFSLPQPPGKTLCIGGGYIALECAGFISGLGMEPHVLVRSRPLRGFDGQMAELLTKHMKDEHGVRFIRGATPSKIEQLEPAGGEGRGRLRVSWTLADGVGGSFEESDEYDTVLLAIGRDAQTANLGLECAGVRIDAASGKIVSDGEQTSAPHIHAIGDVLLGKPELTPVAIRAGRLLARRLCGAGDEAMDYAGVPTVVFTPLEYACVGVSEEEALSNLGEERVEVFHSFFKPLEWTLPHRADNACFAKLICDRGNGLRVLGVHLLGPDAGEVLQGFALALKLGCTKHDFDRTVGIHPTVAEELVGLSVTKRSGADPRKTGC